MGQAKSSLTFPRLRGVAGSGGPVLASASLMLAGFALRAAPLLAAGFPLVDGGMFYVMARDIQAASFALPVATSYNGGALPFAYPPLALYLAALLDHFGPWTLLDVLTWLPLALNLLALPAVYRLAKLLIGPGRDAALALVCFALLPGSYRYFIVGGGLTRAAGFLFATLALGELALLYQRRERRHIALAGLFGALTALSHPQMAWFLLISAVVLLLVFGRARTMLLASVGAAGVAALLSAPWWVTVGARHGPGIFPAAMNHGWPIYSGLLRFFIAGGTSEPFFPLIFGFALLGAVACPRHRWLAGWALAVFALDGWTPEKGGTLPIALLAGVGMGAGLEALRAASGGRSWTGFVRGGAIAYAAFATLFFVGTALPALSPGERAAMAWARENTPADSRFIIATGDRWGDDRSAEWFPALAGRVSVNTAQGYEWTGSAQFSRRIEASQQLRECARADTECIEQWLHESRENVSFIYVAKRPSMDSSVWRGVSPVGTEECCRFLRDSLARDGRYALRFDNPDAVIFERTAR